MRSIYTLASLCFVATTGRAAAAQNPGAIEHHLRYGVRVEGQADTAMELVDRMRSYHVPGVSIAVIDNYRVVFAKGFGVTEFGGTKAVDTTTLFLAGSISKPVFTSGFLRVAEDRKISLDADINTLLKSWHLPESKFTEREKVTPRRLLTHSAGLTVWGFPGYALGGPVPTVPQLLDGAAPANTPAVRNDTIPGARWLYSGGGITILQLATTDITGEEFPALMHRLVLQPAGMARSTYENPLPVNRRGEAASGHEQIDTPVPGGFHVYPEMAAAGLWTTPSDLARWAIALSHSYRGERGGVLSTSMARQMVSKQMRQQPPYGTGYWGLGVAVGGDGDSLTFSHGGRDEGFVADMFMRPGSGRGLVIMMNGVNGGLMSEIERAFAEEYGFGAGPRVIKTIAAKSPSELGAYVGRYVGVAGSDTARFDVSVAPDGKSLQVYNSTGHRALPIAPLGGDRFVGLEGGGEWTFERTGDLTSPVRSIALGTGPNRRVLFRERSDVGAP
ncbi:MAG TPA: serine hydrolase domain-containing protein [Gemmatimonadaceae bacterium]